MAQEKDVSRLVLELSADVSKLSSGLQRGQRISEQRTAAIARAYDQMEKRTSRSTSNMGMNIQRAIGGLALAAAAREVQQYADTWTRATNQLMAAGNSQEQAGAKLNDLTEIALRSRSSLEGTITLYNRLIATSGDLGVSQQRVARVVETVNKALATSNMTGGERQSAITQLAQGLGSGTLAGDELKAIRENSQALSQAIADEFGVSIGELKKLGEEGKLTSAKVFAALENATAKVETAFGRTRATIDDSFTNLQTKVTQYVGQLDAATGASARTAEVIAFVADHLDDIAKAAGLAAVVVGSGYAAAMAAAAVKTGMATVSMLAYQVALIRLEARATGATAAQIALNAAMTANPIGLLVVAVAALAGGLYILHQRQNEAQKATVVMNAAMTASDKALQAYEDAAKDAANATAENAKQMKEAAEAARLDALYRLESARATRVQTAALAAQLALEARVADQQASRGGSPYPGMLGGQSAVASQKAKEAQDLADAAATAEQASEATYQRILRNQASGAYRLAPKPPEAPKAEKTPKPTGPTPEELAATRAMLALEARLNLLRAQGRESDAEQVQAQIDTIRLTKELTDAKVADAAAVAKAQIDAVRNAEAMTRGRENALERTKFFLDAAKEALVSYNEEQDRQLQLQIDIARLEGNDTVVRMLERELRLRQAINALGPNALPEQVAGVRRDNTRLTDAEDKARYQEKGQDMAASFISIIRADDIGAEIGNRFRAAAFDKLQDVIGNLFSQLMQAGAGGGGSGGWIGAATRLFGGGRALGGPVKAGMTYKINETTPRSEYFTPAQNGYVGNMPKAKGQPVRQNVTIRQGDLYLAGANGDAVIYSNVRRMMDQNRRQTIADVKAGAPAAQLEQQLLRN